MLQEISRASVAVTKNEEASLWWHNSTLTVRTEKDIIFYEFSKNLQCFDKKIDYVACSLTVSRSSPLTGHIPHRFMSEGVSNLDYTEMILDPSLWPHNQDLAQEMTNIADVQWSPAGIIPGNECALAVLNNIGNIDIYCRGRFVWTKVMDLSEIIRRNYMSTNKMKTPKTMQQLKELAYALETSAVSWSPKMENNSCLFATTQKNGNVMFWSFSFKDLIIKPEFLGNIQTDAGEVVSMLWIPKTSEDFVIVSSNVHGEIFATDYFITDNKQIEANKSTTIWPYKDKMVTKYICYNKIGDSFVLMCNKHRHILVIVIDKNLQVIAEVAKNVNDYRITDIKSNDFGSFLTTVNCKIYKIEIKITMNEIDLDLELIQLNDSYSTYDLYSFASSSNNVICALAMKDRKILHRQRTQKCVSVIFFHDPNSQADEQTILLNNMTGKLTNYWDCIEVLRYKTMKTKILPAIDFDEFYEEAFKNIYKLKLYHIFLQLFLSIENLGRNKLRKMLPEMSLGMVKDKILALHASQIVAEFHENNLNGDVMLDDLQVKTYISAKKYLQYYCTKHNRKLGEFVNLKQIGQQLKKMPQVTDKIICQSCDKEVHGFTCEDDHLNMFCSVTFTPIDTYDYLVCRSCGATARIELYLNSPLCTFCDLYLSSDMHLPT